MMKRTMIAVVALIATTAQAQQPLPVPKTGSCPSGYRESGSYCAPTSDRTPAAIVKQGQCPSGWTQSGAYCIEMRRR
jgi:hypothetical protein